MEGLKKDYILILTFEGLKKDYILKMKLKGLKKDFFLYDIFRVQRRIVSSKCLTEGLKRDISLHLDLIIRSAPNELSFQTIYIAILNFDKS